MCLYLKLPGNVARLIFQVGIWVVHIQIVHLANFEFLARFKMDYFPTQWCLVSPFEIFAREFTCSFSLESKRHTLLISLRTLISILPNLSNVVFLMVSILSLIFCTSLASPGCGDPFMHTNFNWYYLDSQLFHFSSKVQIFASLLVSFSMVCWNDRIHKTTNFLHFFFFDKKNWILILSSINIWTLTRKQISRNDMPFLL